MCYCSVIQATFDTAREIFQKLKTYLQSIAYTPANPLVSQIPVDVEAHLVSPWKQQRVMPASQTCHKQREFGIYVFKWYPLQMYILRTSRAKFLVSRPHNDPFYFCFKLTQTKKSKFHSPTLFQSHYILTGIDCIRMKLSDIIPKINSISTLHHTAKYTLT